MGAKGFIFTAEAALCLILAVGMSGSLFLLQDRTNLNDILLYQYAQDAAEVCAKKQEYSLGCIEDAVRLANPNLIVRTNCENNAIKREYSATRLSFCITAK